MVHTMAQATVVQRDKVLPMSKFTALVASACQVGLYVGPSAGVINEVAICMHVKGGPWQASLALGFQQFNPHGVLE